jgi:hypothetical protein
VEKADISHRYPKLDVQFLVYALAARSRKFTSLLVNEINPADLKVKETLR